MSLLGKQNLNDTASENSGNALLAGTYCFLSANYSKAWVLDSGASGHMCCSLDVFDSYETLSIDNFITIPDGTKVKIIHMGTIKLNNFLTLKNVPHVPTFQFNLISIQKICSDHDLMINFTPYVCTIQGPSMNLPQLFGRQTQGLYFVDSNLVPTSRHSLSSMLHVNSVTSSTSQRLSNAKLLHLRIGHVPYSKLSFIHSNMDIDIKFLHSDCICTICPAAKQHRLSFHSSSIKTTKIFQLLHIDVWGPYGTPTHDGCKYFLTVVDDYSRATWIHLMKSKLDTVPILSIFLQFIKTQFHTTVEVIRTNNALELCFDKILDLYHHYGILYQTSCSDTPQQNGVVERKHKHLMETPRALVFESKLPTKYWGHCVQCAAFLINRMPIKHLDHVTPYERLFGTKPDYSYLRCFGCLCFVSTPRKHISKLEPRAHPCVFLGYPPAQKGYKVLDLITNKVIVSRDIIFHERNFPFHMITVPSSTQM